MKNKSLNLKKLIYAFFILGMVSLVGCKREELGLQETSGIKKFFQENQPKSEFFVVNAGVKSSIKCKKGTVIKIDANSLLHQNGTPVTGNVTIEMKEVFTKADMVRANVPTVSNGKLLVSQGEFYINAIQNGESLKIKPQKPISIYVPNFNNATKTMLFSGDSIPNDSTPDPTDTIINWNPLDTTIIPPTPNDSVNDTTSTSYFYFPISGFGWLNCDYFYGNTNSTNISIKIDGFNYLNCYVYLFFRDMHSLLPILYSTTSFEGFSIPIGQNVTIIAIGEKEGQYFSRFEDITISPNATLILEMNPTTEAQINKTLDNL